MHRFRDATQGGSVRRTGRSHLSEGIRAQHDPVTAGLPWYGWLFDRILAHTPDVAAVLEVGAGAGLLWTYNYDRLPMAWWVWLTDLSPDVVTELRNAVDGAPQVTVTQGEFADLPLGDSAFDTVVANHLLEILDDPAPALEEFDRVLRPGGSIVIAADGPTHLIELDRLLAGRVEGWRPLDVPRFHLGNGALVLADRFAGVRLERFSDGFRLLDPDAVMGLLTMVCGAQLSAAHAQEIRAEVVAVIDRDGAFRLTTDTGLFVATAR
ncbi:Methyltransferase domain-containing protein [Cryptosporangium aurantiacum]|uniref:Methyltransferase domain-containing protein n=1 Tax=Cryptosporangium aurantiacum TaxID=134849 RepID=A0A1M7RKE0_9ACTN|nr:Methyltransferase domain-containing protein [Cryptosporangium aurantiacum]